MAALVVRKRVSHPTQEGAREGHQFVGHSGLSLGGKHKTVSGCQVLMLGLCSGSFGGVKREGGGREAPELMRLSQAYPCKV